MKRRVVALLAAAAVTAIPAATATAAAAKPTRALAAGPATGIRHVFVIVAENESYDATWSTNPNPYLAKKLRGQGRLLRQYYAVGHASLDNYLAMFSGQAPNAVTQSDCQTYFDLQPGVVGPDGQAIGEGCVYPASVKTLADQLDAARLSWRGYMDEMGSDPSREPARCGAPGDPSGLGVQDHTQSATAKDQYAARHNPFVYFHSVLDSGACQRNVVPLTALAKDLRSVRTTPNFAFITPNLCNDGHDAPCTGKDTKGSSAGGLTSVDHFLSVWVPKIMASPAFRKDGLLIVTNDESTTSDTASCCGASPGPGSPMPGITGQGGGRIGALLVGRCVPAKSVSDTPYNHYALLRSLEDLFGIRTGGSDGQGHLAAAGAAGLKAFGPDVFSACPRPGR